MEAFKSWRSFSFLEELSIQIKAYAASAALVICLGILGASAYVTLDKSQQGLFNLSTTILPKQQAFAKVEDAIVAVQMKTFRYVSWASNGISATLLKTLSNEVAADLLEIRRDIRTLAHRADLTETQRTDLKDLISKWESYENSAGDTIDVGSTDAPMATMMLGQTDEKFMALAADFQRMSNSVVARTNELAIELYTDAEQKKVVLAIGAAIGLLLSVVISTLVSRSIVEPIRSVTHAMQKLSSGDTEGDVGYRGRRDEVGQMVGAIEVFRQNAIAMRAMELANLEAEKRNVAEIGKARARLTDAIESISEGFSLYDADDKLVVFNSKYKTLFSGAADLVETGTTFETIIRAASKHEVSEDATQESEAWLAQRLAEHRAASGTHIQHRSDGRYIQISERNTAEGGVVAIYADITEVKQREAELARLLKEVEEHTEALNRSVEEMRALDEVGRAVSSTLDLETVLATVITHAVELSKADAGGTIYEFDEQTGAFVPRASHAVSDAMVESLRNSQIKLGESSLGICAERRAPFQNPDVRLMHADPLRDMLLREGVCAVLAVPLLREERVIGGLVIRRKSAGAFSQSVVTLLQTFAAQSVLAIQNARLFREIQEKGEQLEAASQHKSQFLANMSHELRTPLNAIIGVTEMLHEDAVDLKREDELEPLERVLRAAKHLLALINDILDLSKIEVGKMDIHVESFAIEPLDRGRGSAPSARWRQRTATR